jgi:hypothetical protein
MSTKKLGFLIAVVTAISLISVSAVFAVHLDVTLKGSAVGTSLTATTPYSPKMTCGGCHFNCADSTYSNNKATWCDGSVGREQKDCSVAGACPDYQSGTTTISKVQGYQTVAGTMVFDTYEVTAPMHGASTGKHSTEGRNEGLATAQRTIWSAPATISSPGMFGRY